MSNTDAHRFVALSADSRLSLPLSDHFSPADHVWSQAEIDALTLACAARRPLLVRGEPGSGKSQLARAAACVLGNQQPFVAVIQPRFEAADLLYCFDAIARLADAQLRTAIGTSALDPTNERYVRKGALWQAFEAVKVNAPRPVLLIDEIDKADADVPNSLLDVLGNRSFTIPPLEDKRVSLVGGDMPLVIITTNEERELPAAFIRRCVVLNLNPPKGDELLLEWLVKRASAHEALMGIDRSVVRLAARQVLADRKAAELAGMPAIGLAELVDLLTALADLTQQVSLDLRLAEQERWLDKLSAYALVKHAGQDQQRRPIAPDQMTTKS